MILPREPAKGDGILYWARDVQRLLRDFDRRLNSILPKRPTTQITQRAESAPLPWDLMATPVIPEGGGDPTGYDVTVWPGTINGLLPENIADADGLAAFSVAASGVVHFVARATTDGKAVTSVEIVAGASPAAPQEPALFALPTTCEVEIGLFVAGACYNVAGGKNLSASGQEVLREDADGAPEYGRLNYRAWFAWIVQ